MTLIGAINIPIIHYSVNGGTVTSGPTVTKFDSPHRAFNADSTHYNGFGLHILFLLVLSYRIQYEILRYDRNANWVRKIVQ